MQRAVKGQDQLAFIGADSAFSVHPGNTQSIAEMMRLAMEGFCPSVRYRSRAWLLKNVGVKVVDEGVQYATEAAATGLR